MTKRGSSRRWLKEHHEDRYVRLAKAEGLRSRAAFKLLEINERERLLRPGRVVVDLGAAPGGWSEVAARLVGPRGRVIAVDRLPMSPLPGIIVIQGDLHAPEVVNRVWEALGHCPADVLLSDLAPNLSGIPSIDQARIAALADAIYACSMQLLRRDGDLLIKLFRGTGLEGILARVRGAFREVRLRKPQASRHRSGEIYAVGKRFLAGQAAPSKPAGKGGASAAVGFCSPPGGLT